MVSASSITASEERPNICGAVSFRSGNLAISAKRKHGPDIVSSAIDNQLVLEFCDLSSVCGCVAASSEIMVASLKTIAYRQMALPSFHKTLKTIGSCPYDLAEPILKLVTYHQLTQIEDNTPELVHRTMPLWKLHTLKAFPDIKYTHDIEAEDIDWRTVFQELQEERRAREEAARAKLKQNYNQIADAKNGRKIQVTQLKAPTRQQIRNSAANSARNTLGLPTRGSTSIMGKAVKATLNSFTRNTVRPSMVASVRPNPNTRVSSLSTLPAKSNVGSLPVTDNKSRPSKFLLPKLKR